MFKTLRQIATNKHRPNHQPDAPVLDVAGLTMRYDNRLALDNITFQLHNGERIAIVGPNGAGKSTLFNIIAGVIAPTAGQVRIYGHAPGQHTCIAYVPQRTQVDWDFPITVADVVMMGRVGRLGLFHWPRAADHAHAKTCLDLVGMAGLAQRQIGALSGGQQQRMFIARALAQEAKLILMDEPLAGLDVASQQAIFDILDALRQRAVTVMVATHDLTLAAERFDRVMLLNRQILGFGDPATTLTTEHMLAAYGGNMHLIEGQDGGQTVLVADSCCSGKEAAPHG